MAHLLLRGSLLAPPEGQPIAVQAVLFDKDGTLSHSEPMLLELARIRVQHCLELVAGEAAELGEHLRDLLQRAYGLEAEGVHPGGITAVGARDHNLIATATALSQAGMSWPDAHAIAEEAFASADAALEAALEATLVRPTTTAGEQGGSAAPQGDSATVLAPQPLPGLIALLDRLAAAGLVCAVISNDHEQGIRTFLARHGLQDRFAGIWSAEHHPRKPSAGAVHGLCATLGIPAGRCALIGDAASDLRMAAAAGVPLALGYRGGWRRPPRLDPGSLCLEHWDELDARPA